jgi:hypothetical protein
MQRGKKSKQDVGTILIDEVSILENYNEYEKQRLKYSFKARKLVPVQCNLAR